MDEVVASVNDFEWIACEDIEGRFPSKVSNVEYCIDRTVHLFDTISISICKDPPKVVACVSDSIDICAVVVARRSNVDD